MKLYGPSTVIRGTAGSCNHEYERESFPTVWSDEDRTLPFIECAKCEKAHKRMGWTPKPQSVELTPDEKEQKQNAEDQGNLLVREMARVNAETALKEIKARQVVG